MGISLTSTYTYDANGIRTSKSIPINKRGMKQLHTYVTQNGKIVRESYVNTTLDFIYDESGQPFAMTYTRGVNAPETYYYVLNLQGDVVKLIDENGTTAAEYTYNAWGEILTVAGTMASINPLRYRGYYYDTETGFYYLQSRYYDPVMHRFINADMPEYSTMSAYGLNNSNLFAYCQNNPVAYGDKNGEWLHLLIGAVVGVVAQYVSDVATNLAEGKTGLDALKPSSSIIDYAASAASGAIAASGIGIVGSTVANAAINSTAYLANTISKGEEPTLLGYSVAAGVGAISGLIGGRGANGNRIKGVYNTAKDVLSTAVSPKKIAMYTAKVAACKKTIVSGVARTVTSILFTNVGNRAYQS